MKCPRCNSKLEMVLVKIEGARSKAVSMQCDSCGYFDFEDNSAKKIVSEIKENEAKLKLKSSIIKLSQGRLGMYINKDVARSLNLKGGEDVLVSIPDKNKIIIEIV